MAYQPLSDKHQAAEGFAEEAAREEAARFDQVAGWFRDSIPAQRRMPAVAEIEKLAQLIDVWAWMARARQPRSPQLDIDLEKDSALRHAAAALAKALPPVLDPMLRIKIRTDVNNNDDKRFHTDVQIERPTRLPDDPAVTRLVALRNALLLALPYIGPPSKQGPPKPIWHHWVAALEEPVRNALLSAGYRRASPRDGGPLVKVICRALLAIEGDHPSTAVEAVLKRRSGRVMWG
jgi:hypothetical protein